jgi:biopolymer transport protein ExbD
VLLIIFVITTPLLEQSIPLKLPRGGQPAKKLDKNDIRTVEITSTGVYAFEKEKLQFPQIAARITQAARANPNLIVYVRADKDSRYELLAGLFDLCQRNGIKISLATDPTTK